MRSQQGFTLLELVLGIAISSFILAATFFLLHNGLLTQKHNFTQERLFNEGRQTINAVANELRQATVTDVSADGKTLSYTTHASRGAKAKRISLDAAGQALYIDDLSQTPTVRTTYAAGLLHETSRIAQHDRMVELSLYVSGNVNGTTRTLSFQTMVLTGPLL